MPTSTLEKELADFIKRGIRLPEAPPEVDKAPFWSGLRDTGTELWLDTGDIAAAGELWTGDFSALTTNNTLLNAEVQTGQYDDLIREASNLLKDRVGQRRVIEIAFLLNARHGLAIAQRFGCKVSVELHTDLADDMEASIHYARRIYSICPTHFIVKVPLTASGLVATRHLRRMEIPVNFTLGFSARQNYLAARFASPSYVNVFLGRINSYIADNELGSGDHAGEKATLASQRIITSISTSRRRDIRQIAASLRAPSQIEELAGVDVQTMPVKVAAGARERLSGEWRNRLAECYRVDFADGIDPVQEKLDLFWELDEGTKRLGDSMAGNPPATARELVERAHQLGAGNLFPHLSDEEHGHIANDGKIPRHRRWQPRIHAGEIAPDTLLNLAGLASFAKDQRALDDRINQVLDTV